MDDSTLTAFAAIISGLFLLREIIILITDLD